MMTAFSPSRTTHVQVRGRWEGEGGRGKVGGRWEGEGEEWVGMWWEGRWEGKKYSGWLIGQEEVAH